MYHFATLFDSNYLSRGLVLLDSLKKHSSMPFKLFVLCLDKETEDYFYQNNYKEIEIITLTQLETWNKDLLIAKNNRSIVEYYFTLSPALPLYILENYPSIEHITSLDADILFFNDPKLIFDKFKDFSIQITPHKFTSNLKHLDIYGEFNVSFQSFRNDTTGKECLQWWLEKCLDWCYDRQEGNRFADQKYLDSFEELFSKKIKILTEKGVGLAPWNVGQYQISKRENEVLVDDEKLIFYHYHHFRKFNKYLYTLGLYEYDALKTISLSEIKMIYNPYIAALQKKGGANDLNIKRIQSVKNVSALQFILNTSSIYFFLTNFICFNFSGKKIKHTLSPYYIRLKKWQIF